MIVTITIDPTVESVGIQTIAVALGLTGVTDEQARQALGAKLRTTTAELYVQGDRIKRANTADAPAIAAAAAKIVAT